MRLQQVFGNLLQNAAKFTSEGGAVTVRSRDIEPAGVAIDIADNGIGIEQEQFEKIFDPFDQGNPDLARRYGGLGLGMLGHRTAAAANVREALEVAAERAERFDLLISDLQFLTATDGSCFAAWRKQDAGPGKLSL
jgi:K+-sensing histidine kinase KdpD